ncbi:hypothetical protein ACET3Z_004639 [Daucus carota]
MYIRVVASRSSSFELILARNPACLFHPPVRCFFAHSRSQPTSIRGAVQFLNRLRSGSILADVLLRPGSHFVETFELDRARHKEESSPQSIIIYLVSFRLVKIVKGVFGNELICS